MIFGGFKRRNLENRTNPTTKHIERQQSGESREQQTADGQDRKGKERTRQQERKDREECKRRRRRPQTAAKKKTEDTHTTTATVKVKQVRNTHEKPACNTIQHHTIPYIHT